MGATARADELPDASGRFAAYIDLAQSYLKRLLSDVSGATAIEYAMIAGGIAVAVVSAVNLLGQNVKTTFFDKLTLLP